MPVAVLPKLKEELTRLVNLKVIQAADQHSPWVCQIVVAKKKSGALRICINPKELNKALQREHYTMPVIDDKLHELREARVFSKADLASGYWHVELFEESSLLPTVQTCFGRYRFLRLPFVANVSSEIITKHLQSVLGDLQGIIAIADNIVIHG